MPFSIQSVLVSLAAAGLLLPGAAWGQARRPAPAVTFSSAYTDFSRDCRPAFTAREQQAAQEQGQDIPLTCKGPGGQAVYVSYSAWSASLLVGPPGPPDGRETVLATQAIDFTDAPGRKLEWRLANGRPFAAILRVVAYRPPADSADNPYDAKYARGASLVAVGLKGFERIRLSLDARRSDANAEARRRVDALYRSAP